MRIRVIFNDFEAVIDKRGEIIDNPAEIAEVAELADAQDSKSCPGNRVWVQVPPSAFFSMCQMQNELKTQWYKTVKALLICAGFTALLVAGGAKANEKKISLSENLSVTEIEKDVFVINHSFPWSSNSLLVFASKSDCVLANTLCDNSGAKLLADWIKNNFGEVNLVAINTGFHVDNLGGNEYLLSQGISIYGADLTAKLVAERGQKEQRPAA